MKIRFFNHWHTGDVFHAKGYVQDLRRQLPDVEFWYMHPNHAKLMKDVAEYETVANIQPEIEQTVRGRFIGDTADINTWIGAYGWDVMPRGEEHGNWPSIHRMFTSIYHILADNGIPVSIDASNPLAYVPTTDFSVYDIAKGNKFLDETEGMPRMLLCNGVVRSQQSKLDDLKESVITLAKEFPDRAFICTSKFETKLANIYFTDDIFGLTNDVNEIAYLSTHCDVIVGKNSGPYMYTHIQDNFFSPETTFVSLSHRPSDAYPCHLSWEGCRYWHHSSDDSDRITEVLREAIKNPGHGPGHMEIFA
jgi:hypothetical protein